MLCQICIPQFLVLVSLDTKTKDPDQTPLTKASQGIKSKGINVYSVGIKPRVDQQDLEDTTTKPSNVYIIPSDQLASTGKRIADTIKGYVDDPSRQTGAFILLLYNVFSNLPKSVHLTICHEKSLHKDICIYFTQFATRGVCFSCYPYSQLIKR